MQSWHILPKRKTLSLLLPLIFIAGCRPIVRTSSEKFIVIKKAKTLLEYLSSLIRTKKFKDAVKLTDDHIEQGNYTALGHALKVQLQTGHREELRYFFEIFVARDTTAVNATVTEIAKQHSTDKVLKGVQICVLMLSRISNH